LLVVSLKEQFFNISYLQFITFHYVSGYVDFILQFPNEIHRQHWTSLLQVRLLLIHN